MTIHQAAVPAQVAAYFGISQHPGGDEHPVITQQFRPGHGWTPYPFRKRVSVSWLRKMRDRDGATHVTISHAGHHADFTMDELLGRERARRT